jgi:hypothetical protein
MMLRASIPPADTPMEMHLYLRPDPFNLSLPVLIDKFSLFLYMD